MMISVTCKVWIRQLKQEDQYVRERFMQQQSSEYFVVHGDTATAAGTE